MRRLLLLLVTVGAAAVAAACNLTSATFTLECAAPDSSSYIKIANGSDSLNLHCFQKANP
ncbi:MAG TPA: hypothetical protein VIV88_06550 [Gemmatimonadales bacterium]|jgi:hypothetical protein